MPTETELAEARQEILNSVTEELSVLRQEALGLTEQSQIDAVIEVIDFWVPVLKEYTDYAQLLEGCSRAIGDVNHVLAAEKYGWESPEADAVFDEQERELNELLFALRQARKRIQN